LSAGNSEVFGGPWLAVEVHVQVVALRFTFTSRYNVKVGAF
jgi:hypothetical protein